MNYYWKVTVTADGSDTTFGLFAPNRRAAKRVIDSWLADHTEFIILSGTYYEIEEHGDPEEAVDRQLSFNECEKLLNT